MNISLSPFFVSTSIAYVNGAPHVGFAMESIEADVLARWARLNNRETFFSTGTDEHGEKIQKTAEGQNTTPQAVCDKNAEEFKKMDKILNISHDEFIRTSDKNKHWGGVQKLWNILREKGDIEKKSYTALYCSGCEEFKLDKDLNENGECPNHLRAPDEISEENYFFTLSKYSDQIAELIETDTLRIIPSFRKNEILSLCKQGLHDVSFSRPSKKLPWGVPVPNDTTQNMYVWCDALTNYISVLGYGQEDESNFNTFWNNPDAEKVHVIGKDIVRFHAGIWIGMLLSANLPLPDKILIHGFLTSEGHKMSKSLGNVVDPFGEVEKYGADALRYFLLREVPIGNDADFSKSRFEEIYQAHLANGVGNLVSRVFSLCQKAEINIKNIPQEIDDKEWSKFLENQTQKFEEKINDFILNEALIELFKVIEYCDKQINEKKPWELQKTNPEENKKFLYTLISAMQWIGKYLSVFLPEAGEKILHQFSGNSSENIILFPRLDQLNLPKEETKGGRGEAPKMPSIKFDITREAKEAGIHAEHVFLENIPVKKTSKGIQKFCKKIAKEWLENGGKNNADWKEKIEAMNSIKTKLGVSKEKSINASESLGNLVEKNGKLPTFTNIVDLYNIVSLKHGLSAGAHDCAYLSENIRIDLVKGGESFEPMGGKEHMSLENYPLEKREYAFFISDKEIGCRGDSGQCEKTKIIAGNKNILIYFHSPVGKEQWAKDAMNDFIHLLNEFDIIK